MNHNSIFKKFKKALQTFITNDRFLLDIDINERTISQRLAYYLQKEFLDWNVDCEYNRISKNNKQIDFIKQLNIPSENVKTDDVQARTVYPDIIVHRRGQEDNLLVIEIKKTTSNISNDLDLWKLWEFRNQLKYKFAIFLKFETRTNRKKGIAEIRCINEEDGKTIESIKNILF